MKMRRFLAAVLALLLSLTALPAFAAEPAVNASEVTLYALDSWASDGYLTIPAAYPESFQIQVSNAQHVTYRRISGSSADVSADGVITPHCNTYYWVGNVGSTAMPADGVYD